MAGAFFSREVSSACSACPISRRRTCRRTAHDGAFLYTVPTILAFILPRIASAPSCAVCRHRWQPVRRPPCRVTRSGEAARGYAAPATGNRAGADHTRASVRCPRERIWNEYQYNCTKNCTNGGPLPCLRHVLPSGPRFEFAFAHGTLCGKTPESDYAASGGPFASRSSASIPSLSRCRIACERGGIFACRLRQSSSILKMEPSLTCAAAFGVEERFRIVSSLHQLQPEYTRKRNDQGPCYPENKIQFPGKSILRPLIPSTGMRLL
jgi:hypothetical protein